MSKSQSIGLAVLTLILGVAIGRTNTAKTLKADEYKMPVNVSRVTWRMPDGFTKDGDVLFSKLGSREYRSGDADDQKKSMVQFHGDIDGNPFLAYVQFEDR